MCEEIPHAQMHLIHCAYIHCIQKAACSFPFVFLGLPRNASSRAKNRATGVSRENSVRNR